MREDNARDALIRLLVAYLQQHVGGLLPAGGHVCMHACCQDRRRVLLVDGTQNAHKLHVCAAEGCMHNPGGAGYGAALQVVGLMGACGLAVVWSYVEQWMLDMAGIHDIT